MENKQYKTEELFTIPHQELADYLAGLLSVQIPSSIENIEDLKIAANVLSYLGPTYSFLMSMQMRANVFKRQYKKTNKDKADDYYIRETMFETTGKAAKHLYDTCSRLITIKNMIDHELKMLGEQV